MINQNNPHKNIFLKRIWVWIFVVGIPSKRLKFTVSSSSVKSSPSPTFLISVCSKSNDGSPVKRPLASFACCFMASVAGGRRPQ